MSFHKLSAFSLASFEMNAHSGGTHRFAEAVQGFNEQVSLSPQAMGVIGVTAEHTVFNQPDEQHLDDEEFYDDESSEEEESIDSEEPLHRGDSIQLSSEEEE